jgi:hypothetical protein
VDEAEHGLHDLLLEGLLVVDAVDDEVAGPILAAWAGDWELAAEAGVSVSSTHWLRHHQRPAVSTAGHE